MKPVEFPEQNMIYTGAGCKDLPAWTDGTLIVSCWELTPEEIEVISKTGKIYLGNVNIQPPCWLQVEAPALKPDEFPEVIGDGE